MKGKKYSRKQIWFLATNPVAWIYFLVKIIKPVQAFKHYTIGLVYLVYSIPVLVLTFIGWDIMNKINPEYVKFSSLMSRNLKIFDKSIRNIVIYVGSLLIHSILFASFIVGLVWGYEDGVGVAMTLTGLTGGAFCVWSMFTIFSPSYDDGEP